jgi:hypothetical protein
VLVLNGESWADALVFTPDGSRLIASRPTRHVDAWPLPHGERVWSLGPFNRPNPTVCIHPSGRFVFLAGRGPFAVVSLADGEEVRVVVGGGYVEQVVVSPDGARAAAKVIDAGNARFVGFRCDTNGALTLDWEVAGTSRCSIGRIRERGEPGHDRRPARLHPRRGER